MATVKEKLPNLKICIDNEESESDDNISLTEEPEVSIDDIQSEREVVRKTDPAEPDSPASDHGTEDVQFNVYLDKLEKPKEPSSLSKIQSLLDDDINLIDMYNSCIHEPSRIYENKSGDFVTGIDFSNKEEKLKREERAKRFGITSQPRPEVDLVGLYESLGLRLEDFDRRDERGVRLDAIHFRGVSEMNTKDVFNYFQEFAAGSIEWIDDDSCNVVWMDKVTAARAMLKLSKSYKEAMREKGLLPDVIPKKYKPKNPDNMEVDTEVKNSNDSGIEKEPPSEERKEEKMDEDDDELDLTEDKGEKEDTTEDKQEEKKEEKMEKDVDELSEEGEIKDSDDEIKEEARDLRKNIKGEIPWPPGKWRLGLPYPGQKEYLFLRFATKADIKLPGAEKRSRFYQKYGNPNYGGMRGLISGSRKRKLRSYQSREDRPDREEMSVISEQGMASTADRNQVSYDGFDIFTDTLGPVEEEGMALYPKATKKDMKKKKEERFSEKDSEEEMQSDSENQYPVIEKIIPRRKFGNSDGMSDGSDSGIDERELEQLLGQATKRPAMKMYADEVEEETQARRTRRAVGALTIVADAKKKLKHVKDARQLIAGVDLRTALQEKSQSRLNSGKYSRDMDYRDSRSRSLSPMDIRDKLVRRSPSPIHRTIENSPPRAVKRFSPIRIESVVEKSPSPVNRSPSPLPVEDVRAVKSKNQEPVRSRSPSAESSSSLSSSPAPSPSPPPRPKPVARPKPVDARSKIVDARTKINDARSKINQARSKQRSSKSPRGMRSDLPQKRNLSPINSRRRSRSPFGARRRSRSPFGARRRSRSPFRPRQNLRCDRSRSPANWLDRLDTRPRYRRLQSRSPVRNRPRWQRQRSRSRSRSPINRRRSPIRRQPVNSRTRSRTDLNSRTRSGRDARSRLGRKSRSPSDTDSESEEDIAPSRIKMTVAASSSSSSSSDSSSSSSNSSSSSSSSSSSDSDSDSGSSSDSDSDESVSPAPKRRPNKEKSKTNKEAVRKNTKKRPQNKSVRTQMYNDD